MAYFSFPLFSFYCYADHRNLHSFPTRRSSDLTIRARTSSVSPFPFEAGGPGHIMERSEEHTSELQSLRHLVCRLLLEKKNLNTFAVGGDYISGGEECGLGFASRGVGRVAGEQA